MCDTMSNSLDADEWRYSAIQVTKYNPLYRDSEGRYTRNEWTDYSCVGMVIDGQEVTYGDYLVVEDAYIQAVQLFLEWYGCTELKILHVEKYANEVFHERDLQYHKLWISITHGDKISQKKIPDVLRLILRSYIWGELFCVENEALSVRFGYDYYMSFNNGSGKLPPELKEKIEMVGLFVEDN